MSNDNDDLRRQIHSAAPKPSGALNIDDVLRAGMRTARRRRSLVFTATAATAATAVAAVTIGAVALAGTGSTHQQVSRPPGNPSINSRPAVPTHSPSDVNVAPIDPRCENDRYVITINGTTVPNSEAPIHLKSTDGPLAIVVKPTPGDLPLAAGSAQLKPYPVTDTKLNTQATTLVTGTVNLAGALVVSLPLLSKSGAALSIGSYALDINFTNPDCHGTKGAFGGTLGALINLD